MEKYKVVDLFAGAGGLSLGFSQSKAFTIVAAAENNPNAKKTYRRNNPTVELLGDIKGIDFSALEKKYGGIDVVIGGPPCQGFSNANRQKAQAISANNYLVKEYVRAIKEIRPSAFVMENVSMLRSSTHRFYYSETDKTVIDSLQISLSKDKIELLARKYRPWPAKPLIDTLENYKLYLWDAREYKTLNLLYRHRNSDEKFKETANKHRKRIEKTLDRLLKQNTNRSYKENDIVSIYDQEMAVALKRFYSQEASINEVVTAVEKAIMFQRMYLHYSELINNGIIIHGFECQNSICAKVSSYSVIDFITGVLGQAPYSYDIIPGVLNAADFGAPQKRERYIIIGVKNGTAVLPTGAYSKENYRTVRDAIEDIEKVPTSFDVSAPPQVLTVMRPPKGSLCRMLRDSKELYNHVVTETKETAKERFAALEQGQNFHDLPDGLKLSYTDEKRTQNTIYLRLTYDEPSGTVVNVRKSMWVHPTIDRALSIREAARLQTFPDSYIFEGPKDSQYQQVGNAVPPILAKAIAVTTAHLLETANSQLQKQH